MRGTHPGHRLAPDRPVWRDALGTPHPRAAPEPRIASLVPSITELLFELGLGDRVVARTTFCIHPSEPLAVVPRVGGTKKPRLERLQALAPTHVIVNVDENRREDVDALARFVPHVVVTHPNGPLDNHALYRLLGGIFDAQAAAERLAAALDAALEGLGAGAAARPRRRVLYLVWREPWMTISRDTYISRMLALVGWETVGHDPATRYPEVTLTPALLDETDLVLLSSEPFPFKEKHLAEIRESLAALHPTHPPAAALIDGEYVSWYGSRAIEGVRYLDRFAAQIAGGVG